MGNLFKFLLALSVLLTGSLPKGQARTVNKAPSFSLIALAQEKTPHYHFFEKTAPILKKGHFHAENIFHEDLLALDEDKSDTYDKRVAALPEVLPPHPFIDLHLAPGFFHKPRKLLALRRNSTRAYAGKPLCVLFGVFLI